jgi:hypothetical protein
MNLEITPFDIIRCQQLLEYKKNTLNNIIHVRTISNKLYYDCKHLIFRLFQLLSSVDSAWYNQRHMSQVQ